MNKLKRDKQETVIKCLVDGNSIRATERITGVHRDTIMRLMVRTGDACKVMMDQEMRDLDCRRIQVDEIWSYVGKKQKQLTKEDNRRELGDIWTFVALDADTKLVPSYRIGKRTYQTAKYFLVDLESRLSNRIQLSSDAFGSYVNAVDRAFACDVDYTQIVKSYVAEHTGPGRYSPPKVANIRKTQIIGRPNPEHASTSYVERQNLTMRMCMRRFTRLTNAFSKKLDNMKAAVALHFAYYNFVRIHRTLEVTPAMAAGVSDRLWSVGDLLDS